MEESKKINSQNKKNFSDEKVLELIGDDADYDGMGDWGRFPPINKK